MLKLEAICINDSLPAPLFTLIVGPSEEARQVGETKKDLAERHHIRHDFWQELLNLARPKTQLFANISPGIASWISTGAGKSGIAYDYIIRKHDSRIELEISTGDDELNRQYFHKLKTNQVNIEEKFGEPLNWDLIEGRSACYIRYLIKQGGYRDEDKWSEIQESMIDAMMRFEKAIQPFISHL